MTGSLLFFMGEIRLDIAFAISVVSCFAKNLFWQHTKAMKTIMQYLIAMKTLGITYGREEDGNRIIKNYSDSNWVRDNTTKKSTCGFIFMLKKRPLS